MTALQVRIDELKARLAHEEGVRDLMGVLFLSEQALAKCADDIIVTSGDAMAGMLARDRNALCTYLAAHFTALATAAELDALEDHVQEAQK